MPTLHHQDRKKERANTKFEATKKTRALASRKAPAKKKASRYASASGNLCIIREDAMDARMIREAREADKGKRRFSVNELRAQRGLAPI
jgi:hypothetical protein